MGDAAAQNRETYDRIWPQMSDYIRHNPGAVHRRRHVFALLERAGAWRSLLDVGCGNAELLRLIDARFPGRALAGVDVSSVVVAQNRRTLPHVRCEVCDVSTSDLPGPVDVIVCSEVLEHLDDPRSALGRMRDALAPAGYAVLTMPTGRVHATERHFGHVRHPRAEELVAWCDAAGLRVAELSNWGFPFYRLTKWATNLNPQAALRRFAGDAPYGAAEIAVSKALTMLNAFNLERSPHGVQLFALAQRR
jgi:SAM-dependent methyltransferase